MRLKKKFLTILLVAGLAGPGYGLAIEVGSAAAPGSPWILALQEIDRQWQDITGGEVNINIRNYYTSGTEQDLIEEMKSGRLDGATFFGRGLPYICREVYVFYVPLAITSKPEYDYVFGKMRPFFEKEIETHGCKVVSWSLTGWNRLFSKRPVFYPEDMYDHKHAFTSGRRDVDEIWKDAGFRIIPTDIKDLMMALQNGEVESFLMSPLEAFYGGFYTLAPNMCTIKADGQFWAVVLTRGAWEKIPGQYRTRLQEKAQEISDGLYRQVTYLENRVIEKMEENDLIINKPPVDGLEEWRTAMAGVTETFVGKTFSKQTHHRMQRLLKEYRQKEKKQN